MNPFRPLEVHVHTMSLRSVMLYAHTGIELIAGSLLLVKGTASADKPAKSKAVDKMYRRWHGAGLLSLSYLGYLALNHSASEVAAIHVCACFHTLAATVGFVALGEGSDTRWSVTKAFCNPHNFLAVGFLLLLPQAAGRTH